MKSLVRGLRSNIAFALILFLVCTICNSAFSQARKLSVGYNQKAYSYSFYENESYANQPGILRKGFLGFNYASYLSNTFYLDVSGDFLIPKRNKPFSSGPMSFNAAHLGISIGANLGNGIDLLAGLRGGLLWNMKIKSESSAEDIVWQYPTQPQTNFTGSLTAGLRYRLFSNISVTAMVSRNVYQYPVINPRIGVPGTPAFDEAELTTYSASLGISMGFDWQADITDDEEPTYRRGAPVTEDRRLSLSYEMRGYTYSYFPNSNFSGNQNLVKKGFLKLQYKHYLTNHLFMGASGGYLIPNGGSSFASGGPIDFSAANIDFLMGIRWGRVSLFTGIEGGLLWDMRIKSENTANEITWESTDNVRSSFTSAFKAGMEYHIFKFLSLKAKFFYNGYQNPSILPDQNGTITPAINSAEFAPFSAGFGVSISIPWKSKNNRGAPPPRAQPTSTPGASGVEQQPTQRELPPMVKRPPESTPVQLSFMNPIPARDIMTSNFGDDRKHEGLDINAETGDDILAIAKGTVTNAGWVGGYGNQVKVEHPGGFVSIYAHLSEIAVEEGQEVEKGERLGAAGNTGFSSGPHLHFELLRMNLPINPRRYIIYDWQPWQANE